MPMIQQDTLFLLEGKDNYHFSCLLRMWLMILDIIFLTCEMVLCYLGVKINF